MANHASGVAKSIWGTALRRAKSESQNGGKVGVEKVCVALARRRKASCEANARSMIARNS
jgi:hypothetical protein